MLVMGLTVPVLRMLTMSDQGFPVPAGKTKLVMTSSSSSLGLGLSMRHCGLPVTGLECQRMSISVGADPPKGHWTAREGALHVNNSKYLRVGVGGDPPKVWTADEGALHINWWC